eukprot:m.79570 g.79570  ORF g.79570 m.79570 type:complete len:64 (-) comp10816_c0_seq2:1234-1425(-)
MCGSVTSCGENWEIAVCTKGDFKKERHVAQRLKMNSGQDSFERDVRVLHLIASCSWRLANAST